MAANILSTLEQEASEASRVPLPIGVPRTSLGSDRSAELEDAEHILNSSLDALQDVPFASSVPLPRSDSRSSSRSNGSTELEDTRHTRHSSLDALERVPLVLINTIPIAPAPLTSVLSSNLRGSLPGDTAGYEQSSNIEPNVSNDPDEVVLPSFSEKVRILQTCLPHLQNIRYPSRRRDAKIDCYDFSKGSAISTWHAGFRLLLDGFFVDDDTPLSKLLEEQPQNGVDLRLIVAEDLSSDLIEQLGSLLDISPEAFEEHLLDSGWRNGVKIDQGADSWVTQGMNKDYSTVKWYRPVKRQFLKPNTYEERVQLLNREVPQPGLRWFEKVVDDRGKGHTVLHSSRPLPNIFRNGWDIHADTSESKDSRDNVAWEEQATIWSRERGSYRIILVLLDPLPTVSYNASGPNSALKTLGLYPPPEISTFTSEVRSPSVNGLAATAGSLPATVPERNSGSVSPRESIRVRPRRGERFIFLSFLRYHIKLFWDNTRTTRNQSQHQGSTDPETALGNPSYVSGQVNTRSPLQRSPSRLPGDSNRPEQTLNDEVSEVSEARRDNSVESDNLDRHERSIFCGAFPRGPLLDYSSMMSFNNLASPKQQLDTKTSTAVDFAAWIQDQTRRQGNTPAHSGPLDFLFVIVQKDTLNILQMMDEALTQIGRDILDDSLMQQRLMKWRLLLVRFDAELRLLEKSLSTFAVFIATLKSSSSEDEEEETTSSPLVADLLREAKIEITKLRDRATSSYKSLMANMSIAESKRGIAEAEGVTKLTELAFFFIPLTFSASIFSMQVRELNAADTSVSAFIILALIITVLSYALRLLIRSESFTRRRHGWTQVVRSDADLSPDAPIPTTTLIRCVLHRLGWILTSLSERLGWKLFICLLSLAVAVGLLVAIWTRPLTSGIKIGATAAVVIILGSFAAICLLRAIINQANERDRSEI